MRSRLTGILVGAGLALMIPATHAVVVLPKGTNRPVMGYLVRQDDRTITVRHEVSDGKTRESIFAKRDLDELIITVSTERLTKLDPARPEEYREYADELSEKQRDPEARDTAIRLYAIAAVRGHENVRRGALLGLILLARKPQEERLFRAAAYLFDPEHDASVLTGEANSPAPAEAGKSEPSWSAALASRGLAPLPQLSLEKLTEFNPAACVYRNGMWTTP